MAAKVSEITRQQQVDEMIKVNNDRSTDILSLIGNLKEDIGTRMYMLGELEQLDLAGAMLLSEYQIIIDKLDKIQDKFSNYDDTESIIIGNLVEMLNDNKVELISDLKEIINSEEQ